MKNYKQNLKITLIVFSIVLTLGATSHAQSIDDVLKPKEPAARAKAPAKTLTKTPAKTVKNPVRRSAAKPKGARVKPPNDTATASLPSETPDKILNRYMNFQQSAGVTDRDWNSIIAQTAKTLQNNPNHSTAKAQSLIAQGQIAYNQRNYSMAIIHFKAALRILPEYSVLHYSLGKAYLANGQAKAAENSFEEAVDQNKKFALAYKGIGDALAAQGDTKKATKYFKKATEISVKAGNMAP